MNETPWGERGDAILKHVAETFEDIAPAPCDPAGAPGDPADAADDSRTEIRITPYEHLVTAAAACALARESDVFRRDATAVMMVPERGGRMAVRAMSEAAIRDRLTKLVRLTEEKRTQEGPCVEHVHPPTWLIKNLFARMECNPIRPLERVVSHPLFLSDGTFLVEPGYHEATGTLLLPGGPAVSVPDLPTRDDAHRAALELLDLVCNFPFRTDADRAGWLAAALTLFAHAAYAGPAPGFWFDKNSPAVGATKLIHILANLADGRNAPISTYIHDVTEMRKQLTAWAIEAAEMVILDNIDGRFGNAALSAAMTSAEHKDRVLGASATFRGELRPIWCFSSINGQPVGDTHRRLLPIRLETTLDHPEERTDFKYPNVIAHARANRGRYISACLTILRAWHVAGRPTHGLTPFDFYDWSGVVREAVMFATGIDPAEHRLEAAGNADPERESIRTVIECWPHLDPDGRGQFASKIADQVRQARDTTAKQPDWMLALIEAAECLGGRDISALMIGRALGKYKRHRFDGRYIDQVSKPTGKVKWGIRVESSREDKHADGFVGTVGLLDTNQEDGYDAACRTGESVDTCIVVEEEPNGHNQPNSQAPGQPSGVGSLGNVGFSIPPACVGRTYAAGVAYGEGVEEPHITHQPNIDPVVTPDPPPSGLPVSAADLVRLRADFARQLIATGVTWDAVRDRADAADGLPERLEYAIAKDLRIAASLLGSIPPPSPT